MLKKEIPKEVAGDVFDRQRCIPGWNQEFVENQRCMVFGAGAIGCSIALCLARLGVSKIYLVDRDVVEASNLNRQILFARSDIGRKKVEAAADTLRRYHVISDHTQVIPIHFEESSHCVEEGSCAVML